MVLDLTPTRDRWMELPKVEEENINKLNSVAPLNGDVMNYFLKIMEIEMGVSGKFCFLEHNFYDRLEAAAKKEGSWLAMTNMIVGMQFLNDYDYRLVEPGHYRLRLGEGATRGGHRNVPRRFQPQASQRG